MSGYDLTDFEWRVIQPLLPNKPRGVPRIDDRRVLNGIFRVLRSGAPWRDLPERYGPRTTCYNRTQHPAQEQPALEALVQQAALPQTKPHRALLLQAEALPPCRNPLRQACRQLPRHGPARLNTAVVARL
jgi:transposase